MKFKDYKYKRPDLEVYIKAVKALLEEIGVGEDYETEKIAIEQLFKQTDYLDSMATLVSIRNSLDTNDEFYEQEKEFFDENLPRLQEYNQQFKKKLLNSTHRKQLEKDFGTLVFKKAELKQKTFDKKIIPELQKENKLSTKYSKLIASAKISFKGDTYNLSQMGRFIKDTDRDVRKEAQFAVSDFFEKHEDDFDTIYDDLVKTRAKIADKLGYDSFTQLAYDRLGRSDYDKDNVKNYRDQVYEEVVPLAGELTERKGKRLDIKHMKSHDLPLNFLSGNPTPKGDRDQQVLNAKKMYAEMSPKTEEFFNFMLEHDLLDLEAKEGKTAGGYCTYIPEYNSPFIFANFNGTSDDVDVLTHEAGHAFQIYSSRKFIPDYRIPTLEAAEIHSMSMEFLAWPWINSFFKEDTDKYKFYHIARAVTFLPYGVAVDEFQHEIYKNPEMSKDDRKKLWRKVEKKYLPYKDYGDDTFLEKGTYWYRQGHIYSVPFYYIDYTLAQVVAFQFWVLSQKDHKKALERYIKLCQLGGSRSFVNLIKEAGLKNPFKKGTITDIITPINDYLDNIDDTNL
ncbi:MAG: M3 family oligoendopeptidase [Candidatus Izimaplasma sp.]|nr:M3 family oligoendopeptidase [Candidatus Izimaplasma bacterium]